MTVYLDGIKQSGLVGFVPTVSLVPTIFVAASDASANSRQLAAPEYRCDGTADDVQIQKAIDALPAVGGKVELSEGTFTLAAKLEVPKFTILEGQFTPASLVTTAWGTTIQRTTDIVMVEAIGSARTPASSRVFGVGLYGINFDATGVGTSAMLNAKYLDQLVIRDCRFVNGNLCNAVYAEECWDWRLYNVLFQACGDDGNNKASIYLYNGADDNCNSWELMAVRFAEPEGTSWYSDSSGNGSNNGSFRFTDCKFEGLNSGRPTKSHVEGTMASAAFISCDFDKAGAYHIDQPAGGSDDGKLYVIEGCIFRTADTNSLRIKGTQNRIKNNYFAVTANNPHILLEGTYNTVTGNVKFDSSTKDLVHVTGLHNIVKDNPGNALDNKITDPGHAKAIPSTVSGYVALLTADSGGADAAVTITGGGGGVATLTDTREGWFPDDFWVGSVVTCNAQTFTVTGSTSDTLTGSAGWSGDPGADGQSWTLTGATTRTLANPPFPGLTLDIFLQADGGNCVVTAAGDVTTSSGENVMTFDAVDDYIRLVSIHMGGLRWRAVHNEAVALS